jgi:putative PIN family toxin of toxin-antitoxin system
MGLSEEVARAYRDADYAVLEPPFVLRIGERSADLDALLARSGAPAAAFLTAVNPKSERKSAEENRAALAELEKALAGANYSRCPAEGRDPRGEWPPEPGFLVPGLPRFEAAALGRRFRQNAIVYIEKRGAAELVDLTGPVRVVLDTNVWLDWLVFDDPSIKPLRESVAAGRVEICIDDACAAELAEVLKRPFKRSFDAADAMQECFRLCTVTKSEEPVGQLPQCRDADDQKFLIAAAAAGAEALITKDEALLELARRKPPFRIVKPKDFL